MGILDSLKNQVTKLKSTLSKDKNVPAQMAATGAVQKPVAEAKKVNPVPVASVVPTKPAAAVVPKPSTNPVKPAAAVVQKSSTNPVKPVAGVVQKSSTAPAQQVAKPATGVVQNPSTNSAKPATLTKSALEISEKATFFDAARTQKKIGSLADNIIDLTAKPKKQGPILGEIPKIDTAIIDSTFLKKRKLKMLYGVTTLLVILSFFSWGFFYSQLNPDFKWLGANLTQQVTNSNQELYQIQADINEGNFQITQMFLNTFAFSSNQYTDLNKRIAKKPKNVQELQGNLAKLKGTIKENIEKLQAILRRDSEVEVFAFDSLDFKKDQEEVDRQTKIRLFAAAKKSKEADNTPETLLYRSAAKLVGNNKFARQINSINPEQILDDQKLFDEAVVTINSQADSEFAVINDLKEKRVNWNEVLNSIMTWTSRAEEGLVIANRSAFDMDLYESGTVRAILFSNYTIDVDTGRISISGTLKTPDEKTFTTIANLVESLGSSPQFTEVDYRSYAKSGSITKGFESNFRIEFGLQSQLQKEEDFK